MYHKTYGDKKKAQTRSLNIRNAKCLGDIIRAETIQFPDNSRFFIAMTVQYSTEYRLYLDENGSVSLIGFIRQLPKGKFEVSRNIHGLIWKTIHNFTEIKCVGDKDPHTY